MLDSSSHLFYVIARGDAAGVYRTKAEAKAKLALAGEMTRIGQFKNYMERLDGTVQLLENGIVQAFVQDETGTITELRLTPREYRLYKLNRSYNPGYSLLTFYRTVALPKSIQKAEMLLKPKNLSPFCHIREKEGPKSDN